MGGFCATCFNFCAVSPKFQEEEYASQKIEVTTVASSELKSPAAEGDALPAAVQPPTPHRRGLPDGAVTPLAAKSAKQPSATSKALEERKKRKAELTPKAYASTRPSHVELPGLETVQAKAVDDPAGLYLMYDARNGGCWMSQWSKTYIETAWAFCKPKDVSAVPEHHFKTQKNELSRGIHSSKQAMALGFIEFIKIARRQHGSFMLLPEYGKQLKDNKDVFELITIGMHHVDTEKVIIIDWLSPTLDDIDQYDAAVVVIGAGRGRASLEGMADARVPKSSFTEVGQTQGAGVSFI